MKPLPNLDDSPAMLLRGKRSALAASRNDAEAELRDAYTRLTGSDWSDYRERLIRVKECVQRLDTVCALWESLDVVKE